MALLPRFRPLIRGFFFYSLRMIVYRKMSEKGFRPLIRGFFFYNKNGINFTHLITCFRPLIRGFFFYGRKGLYR